MDETGLNSDASEFFMYGGIFFPERDFSLINYIVDKLRTEHGYNGGDLLKFATNSRPQHVSKEQHRSIKRTILEFASSFDIRFIVCVTLHDIIRNRTLEERVTWSANRILRWFHDFLIEKNASGVCYFDRIDAKWFQNYLREKRHVGLTYPSKQTYRLDRINEYASVSPSSSHAASIADVILGAFRYCVDARERTDITREIFLPIARMMFGHQGPDRIPAGRTGLILNPEQVRCESYAQKYSNLIDHLSNLLTSSHRAGPIGSQAQV